MTPQEPGRVIEANCMRGSGKQPCGQQADVQEALTAIERLHALWLLR